ncbi:MAG: hypothetical protein V3V18_11965 [Methylococcales bacterium]
MSFSFATGTFGSGDSFRLTADTDGTTLLSSPLGELHNGLFFTVLMEDGTTVFDNFIVIEQLIVDGTSKSWITVTTPYSSSNMAIWYRIFSYHNTREKLSA